MKEFLLLVKDILTSRKIIKNCVYLLLIIAAIATWSYYKNKHCQVKGGHYVGTEPLSYPGYRSVCVKDGKVIE